jgi:uncharacterized membrane protein YccC
MVSIASFPLSAWAFALRIWAVMLTALGAAFWLQLDGASTAATTVGILALQTRGQAYQKAVYRMLGTLIGVVASFALAGLFPQSRDLFLVGFAAWLGLCVYVGGLLDGNRSAILCGYTVALVAVTQIDSPQNVFSAGVDRGAAIVVGIAALAVVNTLSATPDVHTSLSDKLAAAQQRVRTFARTILRGRRADPIETANLLRTITALHPDITALAAESSATGRHGIRQPAAPLWRWSPRPAPQARWHHSPPRPASFAGRLPMALESRAVPCGSACGSKQISATPTRTTPISPITLST